MADLSVRECALSHVLVGKRGKNVFVLLHRPQPDILEAEAITLFSSAQQERKNRRVKSVCGHMFVYSIGTSVIATSECPETRNVSELVNSLVEFSVLEMEIAFIQDTLIYCLTDGLSKHMVSNCGPYGIFNILQYIFQSREM